MAGIEKSIEARTTKLRLAHPYACLLSFLHRSAIPRDRRLSMGLKVFRFSTVVREPGQVSSALIKEDGRRWIDGVS